MEPRPDRVIPCDAHRSCDSAASRSGVSWKRRTLRRVLSTSQIDAPPSIWGGLNRTLGAEG